MARALDYARLLRLPNVFTAMADIGLAAFATDSWRENPGRVALILLSSSFLYLAGMVWNDFFDIEQDKKERPYRPLPSGKIPLATARNLGLILLAAGLALAAAADWSDDGFRWRSLPIAGCLVAAILFYDGWLKRTWAGPLAMGTCRFVNVLLGLSAANALWPLHGWLLALTIGVYIVGVTWFARTEAVASKSQVLLAAAGVMLAGVLLGLTVPAVAQESSPDLAVPFWYPYLLIAFGFWIGAPLIKAIRRPLPNLVQPAVKRSVLGLVLLDAILASSLVGVVGLTLGLLLLPAAWLGRWLYST